MSTNLLRTSGGRTCKQPVGKTNEFPSDGFFLRIKNTKIKIGTPTEKELKTSIF